jgi:hypothetical protein
MKNDHTHGNYQVNAPNKLSKVKTYIAGVLKVLVMTWGLVTGEPLEQASADQGSLPA